MVSSYQYEAKLRAYIIIIIMAYPLRGRFRAQKPIIAVSDIIYGQKLVRATYFSSFWPRAFAGTTSHARNGDKLLLRPESSRCMCRAMTIGLYFYPLRAFLHELKRNIIYLNICGHTLKSLNLRTIRNKSSKASCAAAIGRKNSVL